MEKGETMTDQEAKELIEKHNNEIDKYVESLGEKLHAKNGKIPIENWFKANEMIQEQGFYEKGMKILKQIKSEGFNVKMDMQSNKLVCHEFSIY
jgi:23S rRNA pseudoU1915 N3-methylase RlmH